MGKTLEGILSCSICLESEINQSGAKYACWLAKLHIEVLTDGRRLTWAEKIAFMKDMYWEEMSGEAWRHRILAFLDCSLVWSCLP